MMQQSCSCTGAKFRGRIGPKNIAIDRQLVGKVISPLSLRGALNDKAIKIMQCNQGDCRITEVQIEKRQVI